MPENVNYARNNGGFRLFKNPITKNFLIKDIYPDFEQKK